MEVDVVHTSTELASTRQEWEELERLDERSSYYASHRFVSTWWDAYANDPDVDLHVVTVRDGGRLVGVAPLTVRRERRGGKPVRAVRFAGQGDYLDFLISPDVAADAVCKQVFRHLDENVEWDLLALTNVPAPSPLAGYLLRSPHNQSFTLHVENPYLDLRSYDGFDAFAAQMMPAKTRKYRNKLLREQDVRFAVIRANDQDIFNRIAELHRQEQRHLRELGREERRSLFDDPARSRHIHDIFTRTDDVRTFAYLGTDDELVGYRTCFQDRRRLLSWNSAYRPDFEQYRIGKVLQHDILEHLYAEGEIDIFDFGAGRYPWKFEWTNDFITTYRLRLTTKAPEPKQSRAIGVKSNEGDSADTAPAARKVESDRAPTRLARVVSRVKRPLARTRDLDRHGPVIWYVPHPDDEAIFMGGSIHSSGRRNILMLLSRGGGSGALGLVNGKLQEPLTAEQFMRARVQEFRRAARALGVHNEDVVVNDLRDGAITEVEVRAIIDRMHERHPRASHRTLSYLDPHRDHATAGRALLGAYEDGVVSNCRFHVPVPLLPDDVGESVPLSEEAMAAKRAALKAYSVWRPEKGRYAIGRHSVRRLIREQSTSPMERVHPPGYQG